MKNFFSTHGRPVILAVMMGSSFTLQAQNGPGGIGTNDGTSHLKLWLKADKGVYSDAGTTPAANGQLVRQWNDQSGNGLNATQDTLLARPLFTTTGFNGFPALNFSLLSKWLNSSLNINPSVTPKLTIITVSSSTSFIGPTPFSKLWGNDDGGYDRTIGFDPRASSGVFGYFTGHGVGDLPFYAGNPAPNAAFLSCAIYEPTVFMGFLDGIFSSLDSTVNNGDGRPEFTIGAINSQGIEGWSGNIVEMIVFDTTLSLTQKINVENYLSAKYGTTVLGNDIYRMDDAVNGNFDYDVAGLHHYFGDSLSVTSARGTGIITLSTSNGIVGGLSYFIGHDNGNLAPVTTDIPTGIANRLGRIWAGTENDGDLGTISLAFDLPELGTTDPATLRLLIDRNRDGNFADETAGDGIVSGFTKSGNTYSINVNMGDGQRFTIGAVTAITLPVNLRSIMVDKAGQSNKIQWKTDRETGFAYFDVQRSENGVNFYSIGTVQASKSTGAVNDYSFIDNTPLPANYYRLRMVDQKGQFTYSTVVKMIQTNKRFTISPNPATNIVSVTGLDGTGTTIQLLDGNGKLLEQVKTTGLQQSFYLTRYPKGIYHIKVSTTKESFTERIVKQ